MTDGLFAETRVQFAGYLDGEDLDQAREWAAQIPTACSGEKGWVEVRAIRETREPALRTESFRSRAD